MSLLPASIKRIGSNTTEKRWRHHLLWSRLAKWLQRYQTWGNRIWYLWTLVFDYNFWVFVKYSVIVDFTNTSYCICIQIHCKNACIHDYFYDYIMNTFDQFHGKNGQKNNNKQTKTSTKTNNFFKSIKLINKMEWLNETGMFKITEGILDNNRSKDFFLD